VSSSPLLSALMMPSLTFLTMRFAMFPPDHVCDRDDITPVRGRQGFVQLVQLGDVGD
jgi:hypothetical protein